MTPKEALKNILDYVNLDEYDYETKGIRNAEMLLKQVLNDLERAKKVEELLELYREHHKLVPFTPGLGDKSKRVCDISIEIKQLEKELEEMK